MRHLIQNVRRSILATCAVLVTTALVQAEPVTLKVEPNDFSEVKFISTAKVETFEGTTNRIAGSFTVDPQDLQAGIEGKLEVDMTALSTGIGQRDGHMKENHLHTDEYPRSVFVPKKIVDNSFKMLPDDESVSFKLEGDFTLHGVTHTIQPDVTATWHPNQNLMNVIAKFSVNLEDYNIPLPQFLILRLAQEQKLEIRFTATVD
ncbi:YceI family protein [bacterium]|nr:YceI family protein [bacterium]